MYQDENRASFNLQCNRNLSNTQSIFQIVKKFMFKYSITKTADERLVNNGNARNYG